MATCTVKGFDTSKGFGLIQPDDGGRDAFVHSSAVERSGLSDLSEGQKVNYFVADRYTGESSADKLQAIGWPSTA